MQSLILVGGGGHCKSVIDVAESAGYNILGILDMPEDVGKKVLDYKVIGTDDDIPQYVDKAEFVITVGFIKNPTTRIKLYNKVKKAFEDVMQGVMSLRKVSNIPLFLAYTIGIWASYFLHYYLTFFCFESTAGLGTACAMVTFVVGSIAVVVPTPNGAGPWHFAVKTMLILYGVSANDALFFVLIVHSVQTLLVIMLGIFAWTSLTFTKKRLPSQD